MKLCASGLHACALVVFVGAALGNTDLEVCPLELPDGMSSMWLALRTNASSCVLRNRATRELELKAANTTEQVHLAFKRACDAGPQFTECLAAVEANAEACLEGVEKTKFILSLGLKQTVFDVECQQDGEQSAIIHEEQRKYYSSQNPMPLDIMQNCSISAQAGVLQSSEDYHTPNHGMSYEYRVLHNAKQCLEKHRGGDQDTLVDAGVAQWTETLDRMKCLDPQDRKDVLCKTIIDN